MSGKWVGRMFGVGVSGLAVSIGLSVPSQAADTARPAAAVQRFSFDLPAQPVSDALDAFSRITGLQVVSTGVGLDGWRAGPVRGELSADEALRSLLAGSGVAYRMGPGGTVSLFASPRSGGATLLAPISIEGQSDFRDGAWGPVSGFVATHAASGTKTDTPLMETPQSVSVVTRDEMDLRKAHSLADALGYTAGVRAGTMGEANGYGGDSTSIRGFGGDGTTGPSYNEYLDGMRLGGSGYVVSGLDPALFERIEVLKGPASVLYGQSTPGGIVNMVSKRPTDQPHGEVEFQTGSYGRLQGNFDISDRADADGTLLYRLSGTAWDTDSQTRFSHRMRAAIAPAVTIRPNADTSLTILTRYQKDDFGGSPLNWLPAVGTVFAGPNGRIARDFFAGDPNYSRWRRQNAAAGYLFEHHFDDVWTVRQNVRYMYNSLDFANVYISTLSSPTTARRQAFGMVEHSNDWTIDNQAEANFRTGLVGHKVLFGVDDQILRNDTDRVLQASAPPIDLYNPGYDRSFSVRPYQKSRTASNQNGLYFQDQMDLGRVSGVFGLRQDWVDSRTDNLLTGIRTEQGAHALTKRAALMYHFDSGVAPYFSYSESFDPTVGSYLAGGAPAKPSDGKQYELGAKFQPSGSNSMITASLFDLTRTNVATSDVNNPGYVLQSGEVSSRGLELEGKASLADGLNATAAYTFLDAKVTSSNDTATGIDGVKVSQKGKRPVRVPEHTASLWLDYTVQSGDLKGAGFGTGARYVGPTEGDAANSFRVPGFLLFDAMVQYDLSGLGTPFHGWSTSVTATNLGDTRYVSSCFAAVRCFYGSGRSVYASLKFRW